MRKVTTMIALVALATGVTATTINQTQESDVVSVQVSLTEQTARVVQTNRHLSAEARLIPAILSEARVVQTNRHLSAEARLIPAILAAKKESKTNRHFR